MAKCPSLLSACLCDAVKPLLNCSCLWGGTRQLLTVHSNAAPPARTGSKGYHFQLKREGVLGEVGNDWRVGGCQRFV